MGGRRPRRVSVDTFLINNQRKPFYETLPKFAALKIHVPDVIECHHLTMEKINSQQQTFAIDFPNLIFKPQYATISIEALDFRLRYCCTIRKIEFPILCCFFFDVDIFPSNLLQIEFQSRVDWVSDIAVHVYTATAASQRATPTRTSHGDKLNIYKILQTIQCDVNDAIMDCCDVFCCVGGVGASASE